MTKKINRREALKAGLAATTAVVVPSVAKAKTKKKLPCGLKELKKYDWKWYQSLDGRGPRYYVELNGKPYQEVFAGVLPGKEKEYRRGYEKRVEGHMELYETTLNYNGTPWSLGDIKWWNEYTDDYTKASQREWDELKKTLVQID